MFPPPFPGRGQAPAPRRERAPEPPAALWSLLRPGLRQAPWRSRRALERILGRRPQSRARRVSAATRRRQHKRWRRARRPRLKGVSSVILSTIGTQGRVCCDSLRLAIFVREFWQALGKDAPKTSSPFVFVRAAVFTRYAAESAPPIHPRSGRFVSAFPTGSDNSRRRCPRTGHRCTGMTADEAGGCTHSHRTSPGHNSRRMSLRSCPASQAETRRKP